MLTKIQRYMFATNLSRKNKETQLTYITYSRRNWRLLLILVENFIYYIIWRSLCLQTTFSSSPWFLDKDSEGMRFECTGGKFWWSCIFKTPNSCLSSSRVDPCSQNAFTACLAYDLTKDVPAKCNLERHSWDVRRESRHTFTMRQGHDHPEPSLRPARTGHSALACPVWAAGGDSGNFPSLRLFFTTQQSRNVPWGTYFVRYDVQTYVLKYVR